MSSTRIILRHVGTSRVTSTPHGAPRCSPVPHGAPRRCRQVVSSLKASVEDRQQAFQELDALNKGRAVAGPWQGPVMVGDGHSSERGKNQIRTEYGGYEWLWWVMVDDYG